jgi:cell division protein FtsW
MISLVEVYSASSSLTYESGNHWDPMIKQAGFLVAGFFVILVVHRIPCRMFMIVAPFLLVASIILLAYTSIHAGAINNANRWLELGPISFQPSEMAKAGLIMSVAVVLAKTQTERKVVKNGVTKIESGAIKGKRNTAFKIIAWMLVIVCGLIAPENFSTAAMLGAVIAVMMFIGRIPTDLLIKSFLVLLAIGALFVTFLISVDDTTLDNIPMGHRMSTWKHRIVDKFAEGESKDSTAYIFENAQVAHANMAVANSNIIGRGPGNSVERDFLSHAESDFIFSIVVEELGIIGAFFVIFLYVTLLIRVGRIAQKCQRFFPAFLVIGIGMMMVLQAVVNMGVAVDLFPVTGQPLPFISRGGTSIIFSSLYIGIILSVSRYAEKVSETSEEPAEEAFKNETDEYYNQVNMA